MFLALYLPLQLLTSKPPIPLLLSDSELLELCVGRQVNFILQGIIIMLWTYLHNKIICCINKERDACVSDSTL